MRHSVGMASTYDEVDREARHDRRNADTPRDEPDIEPDLPAMSLEHGVGPLSARQFGAPTFDPEVDPF